MADLRGANPNVYYEVGIANAFRRPVVVFVDLDEGARFDLHEVRALRVQTENGAVANKPELHQAIRDAVQAALADGPVTAVEFAELRSEVPRLRARLRHVESELSTLATREGPADLWRDLALTDRLPLLCETDVRIDVTVAHTEFGGGRIVGHSALGRPPLAITVDFSAGRHGLIVPDPRLYLGDVRAIDESALHRAPADPAPL